MQRNLFCRWIVYGLSVNDRLYAEIIEQHNNSTNQKSKHS